MDNLSDQERAEHIDRYLNGHLNAEETQAFEAALNTDTTLRQELESISMVRAAAQDYGLREEIKSIRQAMQSEASVKSISRAPAEVSSPPTRSSPQFGRISAYVGRVAAGLAILLVGFLAFQYATLSPQDLYAEKAMPYQVAASRSAEETDASLEDLLERQYRFQRYDEVTTTYEQIEGPSMMAMFLAGNAYLQEEKTTLAIEAFRQIVAINGSQGINRFEEDAQYYLALSYLKADRVEEALPLLEKINANPEHSYHSTVNDYYLWRVKFLNSITS